MKPFLLKIGAFLLLQAGLFLALLAASDLSHERNYLAATIEKHAWLRRAPSPRVILVGGSNLAFGIDSERLGQGLRREVVNMGLAGGFGLEFMLNEVAPAVRKGDWVVLSLEYDLFSGGYNPMNLRQVLEYRPASLLCLGRIHWKRVLMDGGLPILGGMARRNLNGWINSRDEALDSNPVYLRSGFNHYGDLTNHYGMGSRLEQAGPVIFQPSWIPRERVLSRLRNFARLCARRGASFYFTCPPLPVASLQQHEKISSQIIGKLAGLPGLTVLDSPLDHAYPQALFFDTGYHLIREGTIQRTDQLIKNLRSDLARPVPAGHQ